MYLTDDKMRNDIRAAVRDLEKTTEGEMVCVIAKSSARYVLFPLLLASLAALALPLLDPLLVAFGKAAFVTFPVQGIVFAVLALLFVMPPLCFDATPRRIRDGICHRAAFEQFYTRDMHKTKHGTGLMLYVSVAERYVGFIGDTGIRARIKDADWDPVIDAAVAELRKGNVREGYLGAIAGAQKLLAAKFPDNRKPVNELDDHLVELPESKVLA